MLLSVKANKFLLILGCFLLASWMYIYVNTTFQILIDVVKGESYYFDSTSAYYFVFVLAPFAVYEYLKNLEILKIGSAGSVLKHYVLLSFLLFFSLTLLFLCFAFSFALYETKIGEASFKEILFIFSIPFFFFFLFCYVVYFLNKCKL